MKWRSMQCAWSVLVLNHQYSPHSESYEYRFIRSLYQPGIRFLIIQHGVCHRILLTFSWENFATFIIFLRISFPFWYHLFLSMMHDGPWEHSLSSSTTGVRLKHSFSVRSATFFHRRTINLYFAFNICRSENGTWPKPDGLSFRKSKLIDQCLTL